ncbi:MAG: hypothetical protein U0V49_12315 [Saprospiraceae bacterium]
MWQVKHILGILLMSLLAIHFLPAQTIVGQLKSAGSQQGIADALIREKITGVQTYSGQDGSFVLDLSEGQEEIELEINHPDFEKLEIRTSRTNWRQEPPILQMKGSGSGGVDLSSVQVEASDDVNQSETEVYTLLGSSDEPMLQAAAFEFSAMRFRNRGVEFRYDQLGFNGFVLNEAGNQIVPYYLLSGLNQLTRYTDSHFAYPEQDFDFGTAGNNQWTEVRAETYRKGLLATFSYSNRSYRQRVGLHYAGKSRNGAIHYIVGANRRWAQEGAFEGTFYDAFGVYGALTKINKDNSTIRLTAFYAPVDRGKSGPVTKEVVDLRSDPLYNPYWGYQEGEKRNARVASSKVPTVMLNYDKILTRHLNLYTGVMFASGKRFNSTTDWFNVADPRPDYYLYLPSYAATEEEKSRRIALWANDPSVYQIDWNELYQTNYQNKELIRNINGGSDSVFGRRSLYTLINNHIDPQDAELFVRLAYKKGRNHFFNFIARSEYERIHSYNEMADLLGGDFYVDYGKFVDPKYNQNPNVDKVNHIVHVGDKFGYDYTVSTAKFTLQQMYKYQHRRFDINLGFSEGLVHLGLKRAFENQIFTEPKSEAQGVLPKINLSAKVKAVYKISGRHYAFSSLAAQYLNPSADQVFINPAWRYGKLPVFDQTKIYKADLSYRYAAPGFRVEVTGFYNVFKDQIRARNFYLDANAEENPSSDLVDGGFINGFYTGLDERHIGVELTASIDLSPSLEFNLVAQKGEYLYISRPQYYFYDQYSPSAGDKTIYLKNFYVPGTPQLVASGGLKYAYSRNGFATVTLNYLDDAYVEINPLRRIPEAVDGVDRNSSLFRQINDQEKLPSALLINASVFKGFYIYKKYVSLSLNVNNLLNKKNLYSGGFEQSRFDYTDKNPDKFPNKYFHIQGINYFLNLNLSLN